MSLWTIGVRDFLVVRSFSSSSQPFSSATTTTTESKSVPTSKCSTLSQLPNAVIFDFQVKFYLRNRRYHSPPDRMMRNSPTPSTRYYRLSESKTPIHFVESIPVYQQLLNRLFNDKKSTRELMVGFDCSYSTGSGQIESISSSGLFR